MEAILILRILIALLVVFLVALVWKLQVVRGQLTEARDEVGDWESTEKEALGLLGKIEEHQKNLLRERRDLRGKIDGLQELLSNQDFNERNMCLSNVLRIYESNHTTYSGYKVEDVVSAAMKMYSTLKFGPWIHTPEQPDEQSKLGNNPG